MRSRQRSRRNGRIDAKSAIDALPPLEGLAQADSYAVAPLSPLMAHSHVFFWIIQVMGRRDRLLAREFRRFGVRVPEWRVLTALTIHANASMSEIADLATMDPTTLTRLVEQMVRAGWVQRSPDPIDMRVTRLALTAAGTALFDKLWPIADRLNHAVCEFLPDGAAQLMCLALREMRRGLDHVAAASAVSEASDAIRSAA